MIVRDLFYNTPARLKFMKTDKAEGAAVTAQVLSCALSHPEVSVRYIKDGKEECHTPGDGRMDSCIYSLFGREYAKGLQKAASDDGAVSVTGFVSTPRTPGATGVISIFSSTGGSSGPKRCRQRWSRPTGIRCLRAGTRHAFCT